MKAESVSQMIAWWPNKILPNSFTDHISAFWDVMPTFADIIDQELLDDIDGISFLPTLMEKNDQNSISIYIGVS